MADFFKITDENMRTLAMASPTVAGFDEVKKQATIDKIAGASPESLARVKAIFEQEAHEMSQARDNEFAQVQNQIAKLNEAMVHIKEIEKSYNHSVLQFSEKKSRTEDDTRTEQLLAELDKL